jgi:DeoR/GlpR family transcriptional regulator of sugar metabolism
MLPAQRQDRILAEIERAGGARIVQLAELLGVSDMTVRRDIDVLAARGLVTKVYGGATVRPQGASDEPGFEAKSWREPAAKELIAAAAAALVQPRSTIAVSAGTTTYAAAAHLARIPQLTVVTNSIGNGESSQTILLTGGLRTPSDALVGPIAVQTISDLHVDLLLMGVHGMDPVSGFTTPNLMEAEMNRAMVASAGRLVVLADHTKWGVIGLSAMAALTDASILVSDSGLTPEAREVIEATVGELIIADRQGPGSADATAL